MVSEEVAPVIVKDIANFNVNEPINPSVGDMYISSPILSARNEYKHSENNISGAAYWNYNTGPGVTIDVNVENSPNATLTAEKWIANDTSTPHYMKTTNTRKFAAGERVTVSGYFKADEFSKIICGGFGATEYAVFDLATQTVSNIGASVERTGIQDFGSGWYRIWTTYKFQNAIGNLDLYAGFTLLNDAGTLSFVGDNISGIFVWGTQIQEGYITTYIPTNGATVLASYNLFGTITTGTQFIDQYLYTWDGTNWIEKIPKKGELVFNDFSSSKVDYIFNGTNWELLSQWKNNGENIYFTSNVGIGMTNPTYGLDVATPARFRNSSGGSSQIETSFPNNIPTIQTNLNGLVISSMTTGDITLKTQNVTRLVAKHDGNVGIGTSSPTAVLMLKAGTATANSAPLKFTSGVLNTTAEVGAIEFTGDKMYITITGGIRKEIAFV